MATISYPYHMHLRTPTCDPYKPSQHSTVHVMPIPLLVLMVQSSPGQVCRNYSDIMNYAIIIG